MRKSKQSITKSSKTKLNTIYTDKFLRILLYHQEMIVNMNFLTTKDVLLEKDLGKAATMIRFEYSRLNKELKAQIYIAKKEYQGLVKVFISNKYNKNV